MLAARSHKNKSWSSPSGFHISVVIITEVSRAVFFLPGLLRQLLKKWSTLFLHSILFLDLLPLANNIYSNSISTAICLSVSAAVEAQLQQILLLPLPLTMEQQQMAQRRAHEAASCLAWADDHMARILTR
jgi:hypothetical protein